MGPLEGSNALGGNRESVVQVTEMLERCMLQEQRFSTLEHFVPFGSGGKASAQNLSSTLSHRDSIGGEQRCATSGHYNDPITDDTPRQTYRNSSASGYMRRYQPDRETLYVEDREAFECSFRATRYTECGKTDSNPAAALVAMADKVRDEFRRVRGESGVDSLAKLPDVLERLLESGRPNIDYKCGFVHEQHCLWVVSQNILYLWNYQYGDEHSEAQFTFDSTIDCVGSVLLKPFVSLVSEEDVMLPLQQDFVAVSRPADSDSRKRAKTGSPFSPNNGGTTSEDLVEYFYQNALTYCLLKMPRLFSESQPPATGSYSPQKADFPGVLDPLRKVAFVVSLRNGDTQIFELQNTPNVESPTLNLLTILAPLKEVDAVVTAIVGHQSSGRLFFGDSRGGLFEIFYSLVDILEMDVPTASPTRSRVSFSDRKILLAIDFQVIGLNELASLSRSITATLKKWLLGSDPIKNDAGTQHLPSVLPKDLHSMNISEQEIFLLPNSSVVSLNVDEYRGMVASLQSNGCITLFAIPKPVVNSFRTKELRISRNAELLREAKHLTVSITRREIESHLNHMHKNWGKQLISATNKIQNSNISSTVMSWLTESDQQASGGLNIISVEWTSVCEADEIWLVLITENGGRIYVAGEPTERSNLSKEEYYRNGFRQHLGFCLPKRLYVAGFRAPPILDSNYSVTDSHYSDGLTLLGVRNSAKGDLRENMSVVVMARSEEQIATVQSPDAYPHPNPQQSQQQQNMSHVFPPPQFPLIEVWNKLEIPDKQVLSVDSSRNPLSRSDQKIVVLGIWRARKEGVDSPLPWSSDVAPNGLNANKSQSSTRETIIRREDLSNRDSKRGKEKVKNIITCSRLNARSRPVNPFDIHGLKHLATNCLHCEELCSSNISSANSLISVSGPQVAEACFRDVRGALNVRSRRDFDRPSYFIKCAFLLPKVHFLSKNITGYSSPRSGGDNGANQSKDSWQETLQNEILCSPLHPTSSVPIHWSDNCKVIVFTTRGIFTVKRCNILDVLKSRVKTQNDALAVSDSRQRLRQYLHQESEPIHSLPPSTEGLVEALCIQFREEQIWAVLWQVLAATLSAEVNCRKSHDEVECQATSMYANRLVSQAWLGTVGNKEFIKVGSQLSASEIPSRLFWIMATTNAAKAIFSKLERVKNGGRKGFEVCLHWSLDEELTSLQRMTNLFQCFLSTSEGGASNLMPDLVPSRSSLQSKPTRAGRIRTMVPSDTTVQMVPNSSVETAHSTQFTTSLGFAMSSDSIPVDTSVRLSGGRGRALALQTQAPMQSDLIQSSHAYRPFKAPDVAYQMISFDNDTRAPRDRRNLCSLYREDWFENINIPNINNRNNNLNGVSANGSQVNKISEPPQPTIGVAYTPPLPKTFHLYGVRLTQNASMDKFGGNDGFTLSNAVVHIRTKSLLLYLGRILRPIWKIPLFDTWLLPADVYEQQRFCSKAGEALGGYMGLRRKICHNFVSELGAGEVESSQPTGKRGRESNTDAYVSMESITVLRSQIPQTKAQAIQLQLIDLSRLIQTLIHEALIRVYMDYYTKLLEQPVPQDYNADFVPTDIDQFDKVRTKNTVRTQPFLPPAHHQGADIIKDHIAKLLGDQILTSACGLIAAIHRSQDENLWHCNNRVPGGIAQKALTLVSIERLLGEAIYRTMDVFAQSNLSVLVETMRLTQHVAEVLEANMILTNDSSCETSVDPDLFAALSHLTIKEIVCSEEGSLIYKSALLGSFVDTEPLRQAVEAQTLEPLLFTSRELYIHGAVRGLCIAYSAHIQASVMANPELYSKCSVIRHYRTNPKALNRRGLRESSELLRTSLQLKLKPHCLWFNIETVLDNIYMPLKRYDLAVELISHKAALIHGIANQSDDPSRPANKQFINQSDNLSTTHCYAYIGDYLHRFRTCRTNQDENRREAVQFVGSCLSYSSDIRLHKYIFNWIESEGEGSFPETLIELHSPFLADYLVKQDVPIADIEATDKAYSSPDFQLGMYLMRSNQWLKAADYYKKKALSEWRGESSELKKCAATANVDAYRFGQGTDHFCHTRTCQPWAQVVDWLEARTNFPSLSQRLTYFSKALASLEQSVDVTSTQANSLKPSIIERHILMVKVQMELSRDCIRLLTLCLLRIPTLLGVTTGSNQASLAPEHDRLLRSYSNAKQLPDVLLQLLYALQAQVYSSEESLLELLMKTHQIWRNSDCPSYQATLQLTPSPSGLPLLTTLGLLAHRDQHSNRALEGKTLLNLRDTEDPSQPYDRTYASKLCQDYLIFAASAANLIQSSALLSSSAMQTILLFSNDESLLLYTLKCLHKFAFEHFVVGGGGFGGEANTADLNEAPILEANVPSGYRMGSGLQHGGPNIKNGGIQPIAYYLWPARIMMRAGVRHKLLVEFYSSLFNQIRHSLTNPGESFEKLQTSPERAVISGEQWRITEPLYLTTLHLVKIFVLLFRAWLHQDKKAVVDCVPLGRSFLPAQRPWKTKLQDMSLSQICHLYYKNGALPQIFDNTMDDGTAHCGGHSMDTAYLHTLGVPSIDAENIYTAPTGGNYKASFDGTISQKEDQAASIVLALCDTIASMWHEVDQSLIEPLLSPIEAKIVSILKTEEVTEYLVSSGCRTELNSNKILIIAHASVSANGCVRNTFIACHSLIDDCEDVAEQWRDLYQSLTAIRRKVSDYQMALRL